MNTAFVVNNFICAAIGSGLSTVLWNAAGWFGIIGGACVACAAALAVWAVSRSAMALPQER